MKQDYHWLAIGVWQCSGFHSKRKKYCAVRDNNLRLLTRKMKGQMYSSQDVVYLWKVPGNVNLAYEVDFEIPRPKVNGARLENTILTVDIGRD